jgi:hypothetical protein
MTGGGQRQPARLASPAHAFLPVRPAELAAPIPLLIKPLGFEPSTEQDVSRAWKLLDSIYFDI